MRGSIWRSLMSHPRRILVVLTMATAFCADQVSLAAPASGPRATEFAQIAQRIVARLGRSFRDNAPVSLPRPAAPSQPAVRPALLLITAIDAPPAHQPVSPFQFRLP